jgi:hypothetical protein
MACHPEMVRLFFLYFFNSRPFSFTQHFDIPELYDKTPAKAHHLKDGLYFIWSKSYGSGR